MKRSTLLASTAALLLSAGVAVAAGEAVKQQAANDMPPPPHGDHSKNHRHPNQMGNKFQRDGLPRGFDELDLSDAQKSKIRSIMAQYRPQQPENHAARRAEFQQKMAQRQAQEQQLIGGKNFDEQAARKLIAERQQERAELERQHAEHELQMLKARHTTFQVLPPAQQKKYIAMQKQQQQRFAERMARRHPQTDQAAGK